MTSPVYITTSWDDGHRCDLRVAEMLRTHGLCGTFYVPRAFEGMPLIGPCDYRSFGPAVEVGAHTLNHVMLTHTDEKTAAREITDSKAWLEDVTGKACTMFCPPWGKFNATHLKQCGRAGFAGVRSVEAWSLDAPRRVGRVEVMPTTVQAMPLPSLNHLRNLAKRVSVNGLLNWMRYGRDGNWESAVDRIIRHASQHGGVLHLWGHSWEVDEHGQWDVLDRVLSRLGAFCTQDRGVALTNGQLVDHFRSPAVVSTPSSLPPSAPKGSVLANQANWAKRAEPIMPAEVSPAQIAANSTESSRVNRLFAAQTRSLGRSLRSSPADRGSADCALPYPHGRLMSAVRRIARVSRFR